MRVQEVKLSENMKRYLLVDKNGIPNIVVAK